MPECESCGFEAKNKAGLTAHQRACDSSSNSEGDSDERNHPQTVSTPDALSEREIQALERDEYTCQRCGATESLLAHAFDDSVDGVANLVTLCDDCDDEISGADPRTKRDLVR